MSGDPSPIRIMAVDDHPLLRRGIVGLVADQSDMKMVPPPPKVYLRTLLFSTSKRGRVIESMHVTLSRNETRQNFNIWVHGDERLVRGSGLFVGETGVAAFTAGHYRMDVFAKLLGDGGPILLFSLEISREVETLLEEATLAYTSIWGLTHPVTCPTLTSASLTISFSGA